MALAPRRCVPWQRALGFCTVASTRTSQITPCLEAFCIAGTPSSRNCGRLWHVRGAAGVGCLRSRRCPVIVLRRYDSHSPVGTHSPGALARCMYVCVLRRRVVCCCMLAVAAGPQVALKFEHKTSKGCTNGPPYEWSVYA